MEQQTYEVVQEIFELDGEDTCVTYAVAGAQGGQRVQVSAVSSRLEKVEQLVRTLNLWELPLEQLRRMLGILIEE